MRFKYFIKTVQNFICKTHSRFGKYTKVLKRRENLKDVKELDLGFVSTTKRWDELFLFYMFILYKNKGEGEWSGNSHLSSLIKKNVI